MNVSLERSDDPTIITYNPANGAELARLHITSKNQVDIAVARSRAAFGEWSRTDYYHRRNLLLRARDIILSELDDIARLISDESGKPVAEAISMEIAPVLDLIRFFAQKTKKLLKPKRIGLGLYGLMGRSSKIVYHPIGVVGIIAPWNYPFSIPLGEAAMALMAGNTVIIKPSELTPLVGLRILNIFEKAGLPEGVLQVLVGNGETGEALVSAAPDKIMFTGSVATGKKVLAAAADKMTPVVLELGGKDPMIVLEDANLALAADAAVWGAFANSGQSCSSVERLYVHKKVADDLTKLIVEKTQKLEQGFADPDNVSIGAMSSERQVKIVEDHVEAFRKAGANIEVGGKRHTENKAHEPNLFFQPTVITGVSNSMRPMREETFGPTLPICTFASDEEAISLANDSDFGLAASIWTSDRKRGLGLASQIKAGSVCINEVMYTHGIAQTPWGGFKNSGRGRTHGIEGLMELVQPQHIHTNWFPYLPNAWWMPYSPLAVRTFRSIASKFSSGSVFKTALMLPLLWKRIRELMKLRS